MVLASKKQKQEVEKWFSNLRNEICESFENIENNQTSGPFCDLSPGRFELTKTSRDEGNGGGGLMSVMRGGRVFEKVGVNISTVYGNLNPLMQKSMASRKEMTGIEDNPVFWASGISLVAHMNSPKVPAVHMNTRMFWTPVASWFGGGTDLNPMIEVPEETNFFHDILKKTCDKYNSEYYPKYKKWADDYFLIKHWNETRGVGGIFFDDLNTGNWNEDFSFTKDVGKAFLEAYIPLCEKNQFNSWTDIEREVQLIKRGRYAEFNLVYDRGTHFGLQSGHDPSAVLMSLPPVAKWP
jgi:coproporphyrinogen III oxidase